MQWQEHLLSSNVSWVLIPSWLALKVTSQLSYSPPSPKIYSKYQFKLEDIGQIIRGLSVTTWGSVTNSKSSSTVSLIIRICFLRTVGENLLGINELNLDIIIIIFIS